MGWNGQFAPQKPKPRMSEPDQFPRFHWDLPEGWGPQQQ
jgi:hypothetical protein